MTDAGAGMLRSLTGAVRLAARDPAGIGLLDSSPEGTRRSFVAAVLVAPAYALMAYLRLSDAPAAISPLATGVVEAIAYTISWTAYPVLMITFCRLLQRQREYSLLVTAGNWANALQAALFALVALVGEGGLLSTGLFSLLSLAATVWALLYQAYVVRTTLRVTGLMATGLVVLDVVVGMLVNAVARAIEGG